MTASGANPIVIMQNLQGEYAASTFTGCRIYISCNKAILYLAFPTRYHQRGMTHLRTQGFPKI
eukprot:855314-Pelagomonas_calceolata.AAC.4